MDWTSGYVSGVDYTHGYYADLSPVLLNFALLYTGYASPEIQGTMRYLELGFGQGLSINLHSAAQPGHYWGTDFNPAHAANAKELASAAGTPAKLFDDAFEEFAAMPDLPQFDYITLHGIWSWVSEEPRKAMLKILRNNLKVGGVCYISYNCLPGWAQAMPIRHLLSSFASQSVSSSTGIFKRIESSLDAVRKTRDVGARFFSQSPQLSARLDSIAQQDRSYLAHEFFNKEWSPEYFSQVHDVMSEAKLTYATTTAFLDLVDNVSLSAEQQEFLFSLDAGPLRETVRDYIVNQQFRKDIYVRGLRRLTAAQRETGLAAQLFVLTCQPEAVPSTITTGLGEVSLRAEYYEPVVAELARKSNLPKKLGDIAKVTNISLVIVAEVCAVLAGLGHASPVQSLKMVQEAQEPCRRLTRHIVKQSVDDGIVNYLPSPVTGGGVAVNRFEQMFMYFEEQGKKTSAELATAVWEVISAKGHRLVRDGKPIEDTEENLSILTDNAEAYLKRVPILRQLRIAL